MALLGHGVGTLRSRRRDGDREKVEALRMVGSDCRVEGLSMIHAPFLEPQHPRADGEGLLLQSLLAEHGTEADSVPVHGAGHEGVLLELKSHQVVVESHSEMVLLWSLEIVGEVERKVHGASWHHIQTVRLEDDLGVPNVDAADDIAGDSYVGDAVGVGDLWDESLR